MKVHLFGYRSFLGHSLYSALSSFFGSENVFCYSRKKNPHIQNSYELDYDCPASFPFYNLTDDNHVFISCIPIWIFSPFFKSLDIGNIISTSKVSLIAFSSSSSITKYYSFSTFDKNLSRLLRSSESDLCSTCQLNSISCHVLRTSMIYGQSSSLSDKNLTLIKSLLRYIPLVILPRSSGLRQPVHISELNKVILALIHQLQASSALKQSIISVGGNSEILFNELIHLIIRTSSPYDLARYTFVLKIPNSLFYFLASPLLFYSVKLYASLLRISSDLASFTPVREFTDFECPDLQVLIGSLD